jgi:hypothetical protein
LGVQGVQHNDGVHHFLCAWWFDFMAQAILLEGCFVMSIGMGMANSC